MSAPFAALTRRAGRAGPALPVLLATAVLLTLSPVLQSGSLSSSALANMLPFAAILAIAAVGQTLIIQQGGLDFSVAGTITAAAILLNQTSDGQSSDLAYAIVLVLAVAAGVGLVNGLVVTKLRVTPLVATLGVNALLVGAVQQISGGVQVASAPANLSSWALGSTAGVYNPLLLAVGVVATAWFVIKKTVIGRRFEAVGANGPAATVAGIKVTRYRIGAYVVASVLYAIAGIALAGYLRSPGLAVGDAYLLSSIAAAVIGGTALTGGAGSVVASAVGALFLTQLSALLAAMGAATSINYLVQGGVIAASMAVQSAVGANRDRRRRAKAVALSPGAGGSVAMTQAVGLTPVGLTVAERAGHRESGR